MSCFLMFLDDSDKRGLLLFALLREKEKKKGTTLVKFVKMSGLEMFSCIWPEPAGACWECLRVEPCCGDPCNPADGLYCGICWFFCGWCAYAKFYASAIDQEECALVNHFLILCCNFCAVFNIISRHALRVRLGVGPSKDDIMGWIGDLVMVWCCTCCTFCQELRAVPVEDWDWWKQVAEKNTLLITVNPFRPLGP